MIICDKCGISSHPFNLSFHKHDGRFLCSACDLHNYKNDKKFWTEREKQLINLLNDKKGKRYDAVVPVRGDAEDYYVVEKLISYKLNILVVFVNNFFLNDIGWRNFHNLITYFDCDSVTYSPNLHTYKELVVTSLRKFKNIYLPYKMILHQYVMSLAKEKDIPFVIFGQCQPQEFAGKFSYRDNLRLSNWWVTEHEYNNILYDEFIGTGLHLDKTKWDLIKYPNKSYLKKVNGIFLSNYLPWDQASQNIQSIQHDFCPQQQRNTFDYFENAGSSVYYEFHDLLRRLNFQPKVHDHILREIRFNRLDKKTGMHILKNMDQYLAYNIKPFFKNFLQTTDSGYRWFVKNRLMDVKHLIREESPKKVNQIGTRLMYEDSKISQDEFVKYTKGI
jgi:AraC-like DNA-binding protein